MNTAIKNTLIRDMLLDAGREVFASDPFATMNDVAAHAGMRKSALHYYFDDKAEFFREVYRRALDRDSATFDLHVAALANAKRDPELATLLQARGIKFAIVHGTAT